MLIYKIFSVQQILHICIQCFKTLYILVRTSLVAQRQRIFQKCRRHGFDPWVRKFPWRKKWQHTLVFLPGNPMDRGVWWATVHGVTKESDLTTKQQHTSVSIVIHQQIKIYVDFYNFHQLSKSVAKYSSILYCFLRQFSIPTVSVESFSNGNHH